MGDLVSKDWLIEDCRGDMSAAMSIDERLESILRKVVREELQALDLDDRLLTAEQVADRLGYSGTDSVYRLKREGKLNAISLGGNTVRFRRSDVLRFIKDQAA
jgi:excisionase family DNA binding protein